MNVFEATPPYWKKTNMPKRHGGLYDKMLTLDALHAAYLRGRRGKRRTRSVAEFEANLGSELTQLREELLQGTYRPRPYRKFWINETGKPRLIAAPSFRDVVVQHALYGLVYPIFDKTFSFDSYGCRKGKGTHRAADRAQQFMRESTEESVFLQMDIRKFYYRIDRSRLRRLIERKIKDRKIVDLMMSYADWEEPRGLPIGNLLSQLLALIYLDPLDQYIKRDLKCKRYVRYVDDFIIFGVRREEARVLLKKIEHWLSANLGLELSRWTIQDCCRGLNFVGFRTWRRTRFVRRRSIHRFSKSLQSGNVLSIVSVMGNARRTATHAHFCNRLVSERPDLIHKHRELRRELFASKRSKQPVSISPLPTGRIIQSCNTSSTNRSSKTAQTAAPCG